MPFLKEVSPQSNDQFNYYKGLTKEELIREAPTWKRLERLSTKIYDTKNTVVIPKDTLVLRFKYWSDMSFCITERDLFMPRPIRFNTVRRNRTSKNSAYPSNIEHVYYYISSLDAPRGRNAYVYAAGELVTKMDNLI